MTTTPTPAPPQPDHASPGRTSRDREPHCITLGSWNSVTIRAHWSVLATVFLVADLLATTLRAAEPGRSSLAYWLTGAVTGVGFVGGILVHELAHAVVARRYGMTVRSITLWMLGGTTSLDGDPPSPAADILVGGIGPAVTLAIGVIAWLGAALTAGLLHAALVWTAVVSVTLAVFNLLPAAPLDGGRVLRGVLWWRTRDRVRAAAATASAGRTLGTVLLVLGAMEVLAGYLLGLWLAAIGWFIVTAAGVERRTARMQRLTGIPVERAMTPAGLIVPQWWTVQQLVERFADAPPGQRIYPVVDFGGALTGAVTIGTLRRLPAHLRADTKVASLLGAAPQAASVGSPLSELALRMPPNGYVVVVDDLQRPVGVVTGADLEHLARQAELTA